MDALTLDRIHFAFTITYHYLFPQLTMGLAPLIVIMKTLALWKEDERYNRAARFWATVFGISFLFGVVTGIPMEFQFGTNWAKFSKFAGGVIGQTLAMEGVFAFFLESAFIGLFLFGEKRLGKYLHWLAGFMIFVGTWASGYFIIVTGAWMQRPVGYEQLADGSFRLTSFFALLTNEWAVYQFMHNQLGACVTGSFAVSALGAFYVLSKKQVEFGRMFLKIGLIAAFISSVAMGLTGDLQNKMLAVHQPATLASMEGLFKTEQGAPIVLIGQPNMKEKRLDNPIHVPKMLSFLTYQKWEAEVKGMDAFKPEDLPDNIPLLYYSYHIMVGLGTIFMSVTFLALIFLWRGKLHTTNWLLWIVMVCFPFPFIANTVGWMTAELGRQPWLVYGLMRTEHGFSPTVSEGNILFTLLGFMGLYTLLSILYLFLMMRRIENGAKELSETAVNENDELVAH